jgi:hypothetical protein
VTGINGPFSHTVGARSPLVLATNYFILRAEEKNYFFLEFTNKEVFVFVLNLESSPPVPNLASIVFCFHKNILLALNITSNSFCARQLCFAQHQTTLKLLTFTENMFSKSFLSFQKFPRVS